MNKWLHAHKFEARLASFVLVTLPAIGAYRAAQAGAASWALACLSLIVAGSLLAVAVKS